MRPDLTRLLRDLGPRVQRGALDAGVEAPARRLTRESADAQRAAGQRRRAPARVGLTTGIPPLDQLLGGGLSPGRLSELHGPFSSGRTSVALALLARATEAGEVVGVVDGADAFHPASARAAGVQLERVLWARPSGISEAARCSERLLQARGFAAVLLDVAGREVEWEALPVAVWQRLTRAAAAAGTALIVLSGRRVTGSSADLAIRFQPTRARFTGTPSLFEGLEIEAVITRQRRGPLHRPTAVRLQAGSGC